jgi:magnesium transporter
MSDDDANQNAIEPPARMRAWASEAAGARSVTLDEAVALFQAAPVEDEPRGIVWIDVTNPAAAEGEFLRDRLGFHPLAVEDCLRGRQRVKLERYPNYYFLVVYAAQVNPHRGRVAFNELHIFIGANFIVTVRDHSMKEVRETVAHWRASPAHFNRAGAIAHALLDRIVDDYFPIIDHFSERLDVMESEVLGATNEELMQNVLMIRRELLAFRKIAAPERDLLSSLLRRDIPFLEPELLPYFQDVRDHAFRIVEEIDTLRDLLSSAVDAQLSVASNQLNQTLRMMTAWSIILMSMTLIAGIYGMNFVLMPELEWQYGYPATIGVMVAIGAVLFYFFRRHHWI